jgi:SAM-dependent methyltransferase
MGYYDYYADRKVSFAARTMQNYFVKMIVTALEKRINPNDAVLEIGAGNGRLADALSKKFKYKGYEPGPALAEALRKRGIPVVEKRVPPLEEPDASQNAVITFHVLEHLKDFDAVTIFLAEIRRVLKPGGTVMIICPDYLDWKNVFFDFDYSHNYITTSNRLHQLVRDAGLVIDERKYLYGSLSFFPGFFLNTLVKLLFMPFELVRGDVSFEIKGFWRARYLFTRAIFVTCRKETGA